MSTPERQQDPGEHGYGSTGQEAPSGDEHEPVELPAWPIDDPDERDSELDAADEPPEG